jgi:AAHS family 4-hydroxybenzoate transporter-like MFS transporter
MNRSSSILTIFLCGVAMLGEGYDTYAVGYIGPTLVKIWGISNSALGTLYTVGVIASLIGSVILGALSDRVGRKQLLIGSLLLFGAATFLSALAPNLNILMLTRIAAGIGMGASIPCAMALATEAAPKHYTSTAPVLLCALIGGGSALAGVSAAIVIPLLGWQGLMYVGAVMPVTAALVMIPLLSESEAIIAIQRRAAPRSNWRALFSPGLASSTILLTLALISAYTVTFFFGFWMPTLVTKAVDNIRVVGFTTAFIKLFSIAGSLVIGRLMDRHGSFRVLPVAFVVAAMGCAVALHLGDGLPLLVAGLCLISFLTDSSFSGVIGIVSNVLPAEVRGTGIGAITGFSRLVGGSLGPTLGGLLLARGMTGQDVTSACAIPLLTAASLLFVLRRLTHRDRPAPVLTVAEVSA